MPLAERDRLSVVHWSGETMNAGKYDLVVAIKINMRNNNNNNNNNNNSMVIIK